VTFLLAFCEPASRRVEDGDEKRREREHGDEKRCEREHGDAS
jgi:hypothetical protein